MPIPAQWTCRRSCKKGQEKRGRPAQNPGMFNTRVLTKKARLLGFRGRLGSTGPGYLSPSQAGLQYRRAGLNPRHALCTTNPGRCMHRADLHDGSLHDATCTLHERFLALDHVMRVLELHYARGFDKYCLNFGSRGTDFTHALYRRGYAGLMVDLAHDPANEERFPGVYHFTVPLDAYSVPKVIHSFSVPSNLGVLKVDVDSFDCHILEVALSMLQPAVIIMEVNMMMPPPLMFSKSSFSEHSGRLLNEFLWDTGFWGCSFSYAVRSLRAWGYKLLQLHHIDATFVHESFMAPFEGVSQDTFAWWKHGHLPFVDHERYPQNRHFYFQPFHAAACQQVLLCRPAVGSGVSFGPCWLGWLISAC